MSWEWWLLFALIPLSFFLRVMVHEGSHGAMASLWGYEVELRWFPRWWRVAEVQISRPPTVQLAPDWYEALEDLAPVWSGLLIYFIGMAVFHYGTAGLGERWTDLAQVTLLAAHGLDPLRSLLFSFVPDADEDTAKAIRRLGWSPWWFRVGFVLLAALVVLAFVLWALPHLR